MLATINGDRGLVRIAKGADESLKVLIMKDDGAVEDITGDSVDLIVYDRSDRKNAAITTHSGDTLTTPTAGLATVALTDAEINYGPGSYSMFVRWTDASASKVYFDGPFTLDVR